MNDGGRGDGDRDGGKEEGEGRHQKRAEPEAREEREGGNEERYPGDEGVRHGAESRSGERMGKTCSGWWLTIENI